LPSNTVFGNEAFAVANPSPAVFIDAVAGFNYLVNVAMWVGFSPLDIVVLGDSSGGKLAHALQVKKATGSL
jgi:acetyl esterase/lipase